MRAPTWGTKLRMTSEWRDLLEGQLQRELDEARVVYD